MDSLIADLLSIFPYGMRLFSLERSEQAGLNDAHVSAFAFCSLKEPDMSIVPAPARLHQAIASRENMLSPGCYGIRSFHRMDQGDYKSPFTRKSLYFIPLSILSIS
jgi:hypothetical protein